jgi:hypothetical protein
MIVARSKKTLCCVFMIGPWFHDICYFSDGVFMKI